MTLGDWLAAAYIIVGSLVFLWEYDTFTKNVEARAALEEELSKHEFLSPRVAQGIFVACMIGIAVVWPVSGTAMVVHRLKAGRR